MNAVGTWPAFVVTRMMRLDPELLIGLLREHLMISALKVIQKLGQCCGLDVLPIQRRPLASLRAQDQTLDEDGMPFFAGQTMDLLLRNYEFATVLDIGCGAGRHSERFRSQGKTVTSLDFCRSDYFQQRPDQENVLVGDYMATDFEQPFDCIWASHVLEHQPDPNAFLRKVHRDLNEGGVLAVTVPPLKHEVVGGHVTLWNAGLLLYQLVLAGFDCRNASVKSYGYNISVVVQKVTIAKLPELHFDRGDIDRLQSFLPEGLGEGFNGSIVSLNWTDHD